MVSGTVIADDAFRDDPIIFEDLAGGATEQVYPAEDVLRSQTLDSDMHGSLVVQQVAAAPA